MIKMIRKAGAMAGLMALFGMLAGLNGPGRAHAADLPDYVPPPPPAAAPVGNCYVRGDVGYSWALDPNATYVGNAVNPDVFNATMDNEWLFEAGVGCAAGYGFRGELVLGYRAKRDFRGDVDIVINNVPVDPPISTSIATYTAMLNVYYDFATYGAFTPYVGAGIGAAYHIMDDVIIDHPASPNPQFGDENLSLAWSLMAGVAYRLGARTTLDIGYRYINMGKARSLHADSAFAWNPRLEVDDIAEHEFKIGLRYQFGGGCCAAAPEPLK